MGLETTTFISGLDAANPLATDPKSQGDDHIRLLKSTVKATFPNVTGAVTPTHLELNYVAGVTSAIQTQLNAEVTNRTNADALKANLASPTFTGTVTIPSGASIAGFAPLASPALTGVPTAPTATAGTATTQVATTAFVVGTSLSASLPGQAGNAGKFITTDGTNPSWGDVNAIGIKSATTTVSVSSATAPTTGQVLTATGSAAATWQWAQAAVTSAVTDIGVYVFALNFSGGGAIPAGSSTSGSTLRTATVTGAPSLATSGAGFTGTWRATGECLINNAQLFQRIA